MAPTSKDGSRRGNCPLFGEEAVTRREGRAQTKGVCEGDWRASSVPAAAVIPAPRVSMVDAAVKKSVVVLRLQGAGRARRRRRGWRSGQGARNRRARDEMARTPPGRAAAKAALLDASGDQGRRLEDRK